MQNKIQKKIFVFKIIVSEMVALNCLSIKQIMFVIDCQCVNMVKVLPFRLQQSFDPFAMLCVKGSSETLLSRPLFKHVLEPVIPKNTSAMRVMFFWQMFKI